MAQSRTIGKTATTVYGQNGYTFVKYHKTDGTKGDYDILENEEEVLILLREGK